MDDRGINMQKSEEINKFIDELEKGELEYLILTLEPGEKVDSIEAFFSVKSNQSKNSIKQALLRVLENLESDDFENLKD